MKLRTTILLFLGIGAAAAQDNLDRFKPADAFDARRLPVSMSQPRGVAMESTVDPARYFVGPADVLAVNLWSSPPQSYNLTVTPEGSLIVPTVGEIRISGMTLAAAKAEIYDAARKKYLSAQITATLVSPRPIIVTVLGNVLFDGRYELTAVDRADRAIDLANTPAAGTGGDDAVRIRRDRIISDMAKRSIELKHRDGTKERVDIVRWQATTDSRWNPYLREGDIIVVPRKGVEQPEFGIYGEVNLPGRYELAAGDSLFDAVAIAQGFTGQAMRDSVEFSRFGPDGRTITTSILVFSDPPEPSLNVPLQAGDRVIARARGEERADYHVTISGEIVHPGIYPITRDRSRLSELVRRAGGLTGFAALKSASLNRRSVAPEDVETERLMSLRGGIEPADSADYLTETMLRLRREIVNVDFDALLTRMDSTQDVILRDGDHLIIPSVQQSVYVFGQIVSPGHIEYAPGRDVAYYLRQAGGLTDRAREDDIRVIKTRTKQLLSPDETELEDGDYIWVPREPDLSFSYYMTVGAQAATILSVVLGIAVLISTGNN